MYEYSECSLHALVASERSQVMHVIAPRPAPSVQSQEQIQALIDEAARGPAPGRA